ncbi:MAG TPA: hypothetical protein VN256_13165 [Pyrinomonadaceae bacterium]|nr:hypothetical protein [Pyrinomonadaceae bacterium]
MKKVSSVDLLNDVKRLARELGHYPTSLEYRNYGSHDTRTVTKRFGGSWPMVIKKAGLRYERRTVIPRIDDKALELDIKRVAVECGRLPTIKDYSKVGKFRHETYCRRVCGKPSGWKRVLEFYFGKGRSKKQKQRKTERAISGKEQKFADVRRVARLLGHFPSMKEYEKYGRLTAFAITYEFRPSDGSKRYGSWADVRQGIDPFVEKQPSDVRELGHVADPTREVLKSQSLEAIRQFFVARSVERPGALSR